MPETTRRSTFAAIGLAAGLVGLGTSTARAAAEGEAPMLPPGATSLRELTARLTKAPRRRDFKTVPMVLDHPDMWDHEALTELLTYRGGPRQVWDNTDPNAGWLNGMRNALNAQIWGFGHPDFLVVSATHGGAHFMLYDQEMWEKYELGKLLGGRPNVNALIQEPKTASINPTDYENPEGAFSPHGNSITVLQRRGVVFIACHNAIWEQATKLRETGHNPDKLSVEQLTAELTNHLIPGAVLSPGVVGTLPELAQVGYSYVK